VEPGLGEHRRGGHAARTRADHHHVDADLETAAELAPVDDARVRGDVGGGAHAGASRGGSSPRAGVATGKRRRAKVVGRSKPVMASSAPRSNAGISIGTLVAINSMVRSARG